MMKSSSVICDTCNKEFSSGKALGGHKRIHSKKKLIHKFESSLNEKKMKKKQISSSCAICGEVFPSIKSLSGHMRIHQNRTWRGLQPPPPPPPIFRKKGSSSSSMNKADRALLISGSSDEDDDAANYLLMLAHGLTNKQNVDENSFCKKDESLDNFNLELEVEVELVIKNKNKNKKKKKRKKLCDLELAKNDESFRCKCNTCGKSFPTFHSQVDNEANYNLLSPTEEHDKTSLLRQDEASRTCSKRTLDFDLNEMPTPTPED